MREMLKDVVQSVGQVNLPLEEVWKKLIVFGGTEKFVPDLIEKVIVSGTGVGAIRTIHLKGGGEIVERLTFVDEENSRFGFVIISTPMPIVNYEAIFSLRKIDNNCEVTFTSEYEVATDRKAEMCSVIKTFQATFISNLHR